jgi:hypothetical protein
MLDRFLGHWPPSELALKKRGYPALADMKAKWQRKER